MDTKQIADGKRGDTYLDNGEETMMVVDSVPSYDCYTHVVQITGTNAGKVRVVSNGLRLRTDSNGRWFVCPVLNGWSTKAV